MDTRVQGVVAAVCVFSIRRRHAPLYRRAVRADGTDPGCRHDRPSLAIPRQCWSPGREAAGDHIAHETWSQGHPSASMTTRFAPAPTGYLHLGHVVNAIYVWGIAAARGGRVLLRIEDHDAQRSRPEFERAILDDL